ncbi:hypothetical protein Lalb_Chr24g0393921 [Lupinus albus]|uniref:Uncharacterized protein n=1 Tax=Lupinus albus TaxID=3870 RepID=A0A6A4NG91_LUPAL|nr:hypothetical protein Lalb_Chr24g0393921 [Lupinus albus]
MFHRVLMTSPIIFTGRSYWIILFSCSNLFIACPRILSMKGVVVNRTCRSMFVTMKSIFLRCFSILADMRTMRST